MLIVTDGAVCLSPKIPKAIITARKQVEGEKNGHLKNVILDCVNECKAAGKGRDGESVVGFNDILLLQYLQ